MAIPWILVCHGLVTLLVVVSFLCGQWPIFQGTFIERIHYFITFGAYDYFLRFVGAVFGSKCTNAVLSVEYYCCDRPNPILQVRIGHLGTTILSHKSGPLCFGIGVSSWCNYVAPNVIQFATLVSPVVAIIYFVIISLTYYFIAKSSFVYIPGYYLSGIHRYTSLFAVAVGIMLFLLTSFSDPGTIKAENVSYYLSAYPYDNIIYVEKECSTCKVPKPARSKHCSICNRCVARFDHHCGWMNNCIGERNTRYFTAFLFWHFLLCFYGTVAIGLVLAGRLKELRVVHILTVYYGIENSFLDLAPYIVQWLLGSYNTQILLMVFLAIVAMLLAGFFGYHAKLCLSNTTTNETFKWQEYMDWQRKLNEAKASAATLRASISGMGGERKPSSSKWRAFFRKSPLEDVKVFKNNVYDKGFIHNVLEVIFPLSARRSFAPTKVKSG